VKLHAVDIEVLSMLAGENDDLPWGAAVGASLEWLTGHGYCVKQPGNGFVHQITDKGRAALSTSKRGEAGE